MHTIDIVTVVLACTGAAAWLLWRLLFATSEKPACANCPQVEAVRQNAASSDVVLGVALTRALKRAQKKTAATHEAHAAVVAKR